MQQYDERFKWSVLDMRPALPAMRLEADFGWLVVFLLGALSTAPVIKLGDNLERRSGKSIWVRQGGARLFFTRHPRLELAPIKSKILAAESYQKISVFASGKVNKSLKIPRKQRDTRCKVRRSSRASASLPDDLD